MKVTREQAAANRERVLETAARLFRERGFAGVGVADIMASAGLTHGGFYGQFKSKEDLMAQACDRAVEKSLERWSRLAGQAGDLAWSALTESYVSPRHRDHPGGGCLVATLGSEAARQSGPVRQAVSAGVRETIELMTKLAPGTGKAARRDKAMASFAAMVGALVLSRAVEDQALSEAILRAVGKAVVSKPPVDS